MFSVLIAHYNNSRYLATALDSVLAQTETDWECIIVDDGSTDGFEKVILNYQADLRFKVFRNEKNQGCGFTKARCASLGRGEVMGFLDPDDALHPEAIRVMTFVHSMNPAHSVIYSTHFICDEQLEIKRVADYPKALPDGVPYLLVNDGSIHHFASFKKKLYERTDGISPENRKAVDQDLYYKLEETGPVYFINRPLYYYRIHNGSISNGGQEKKATIAHYRIVQQACLRRMNALKLSGTDHSEEIRRYKTRYYKIKSFSNFRTRAWGSFAGSILAFVVNGGWPNMVSYLRKLPKERGRLLKKSFVDNYEIK